MTSGFKDAHHLLARHSLESLEKLIYTQAILQVFEKRIHRHARPTKADAPAKTLRIAPHKRRSIRFNNHFTITPVY